MTGSEHQGRCDAIALSLFNHYTLRRDGALCRFMELEVYLHDTDYPDPFCHTHDDQLNRETLYWHYSGVDVTMGKKPIHYCGVLVRGIEQVEAGTFVFGPGKVAYDRKEGGKAKRELVLEPQETSNGFGFDKRGEAKVHTLPRFNLSGTTFEDIYGKNPRFALETLQMPLRYLRIPTHWIKRETETPDRGYLTRIFQQLDPDSVGQD